MTPNRRGLTLYLRKCIAIALCCTWPATFASAQQLSIEPVRPADRPHQHGGGGVVTVLDHGDGAVENDADQCEQHDRIEHHRGIGLAFAEGDEIAALYVLGDVGSNRDRLSCSGE